MVFGLFLLLVLIRLRVIVAYNIVDRTGLSRWPLASVYWATIKFMPPKYHINFYPRDAMLARVIVIATCLSGCPSRPGIVSKRRELAA